MGCRGDSDNRKNNAGHQKLLTEEKETEEKSINI